MEVFYNHTGSTLRVSLVGELDENSAASIRSSLDVNISAGTNRVILDFSRLIFMDSTGIGVLVGRYKKFRNKPVAFFIEEPNSTVDKILKLSGIYTIMPKIETA